MARRRQTGHRSIGTGGWKGMKNFIILCFDHNFCAKTRTENEVLIHFLFGFSVESISTLLVLTVRSFLLPFMPCLQSVSTYVVYNLHSVPSLALDYYVCRICLSSSPFPLIPLLRSLLTTFLQTLIFL